MIPARFSPPHTLAGRAGTVVERVLEHTRDRTVIFRGYEKDAVGGPDPAFHPHHRRGRVLVVVLVIQRQVADLYLAEGKFRRRKLHDGIGKFPVERILPEASDDNGNLVLAHTFIFGGVRYLYFPAPKKRHPPIRHRPAFERNFPLRCHPIPACAGSAPGRPTVVSPGIWAENTTKEIPNCRMLSEIACFPVARPPFPGKTNPPPRRVKTIFLSGRSFFRDVYDKDGSNVHRAVNIDITTMHLDIILGNRK